MEKEIKQIGKELSLVRLELAEIERLKRNLEEKDTSQILSSLEAQLEVARSHKESILKEYASGNVTREDLRAAQDKISEIETSIVQEKEIANATYDYQQDLSKKISGLLKKEQGVNHRYWQAVSHLLVQDVVSVVGDRVGLIWAAGLLCGVNHFPHLLTTLFPQPPIDKITELRRVLDEKYGVK